MNNFEFYLEKAIQEREVVNEKTLTNIDEQKVILWGIKNINKKINDFPNLWNDLESLVKKEKPGFGIENIKKAFQEALDNKDTNKTSMKDVLFILDFLKNYSESGKSLYTLIKSERL
jgi:hypothetical protein